MKQMVLLMAGGVMFIGVFIAGFITGGLVCMSETTRRLTMNTEYRVKTGEDGVTE